MTVNDDLHRVYRDDMTYPDDWDARTPEFQDAWAAAWRSAARVIVKRDERINDLERECDTERSMHDVDHRRADRLKDNIERMGGHMAFLLSERDALKNVLVEIATTTIGTGSLDDALAMLRHWRDKASRATHSIHWE